MITRILPPTYNVLPQDGVGSSDAASHVPASRAGGAAAAPPLGRLLAPQVTTCLLSGLVPLSSHWQSDMVLVT